ncbi:MAG: SAM-dependent methyltransferase [Betaproteobacteria bacterium]
MRKQHQGVDGALNPLQRSAPAGRRCRRAARPWAQAAVHADTTVLYMAGRERVGVAKALLEEGLHPETPVGIVAGASLDTQAMVTTLSAMALGGVEFSDQPVCLLVGEVLRARLEAQRAGTCGQQAPSVGAG